jgi:hypothetical protein
MKDIALLPANKLIMKNLLLTICALLYILSGHSQSRKTLSAAQCLEELVMIKTTLIEGHPGLNFFGQKHQVLPQFQEVKHKIVESKGMSDLEFFRLINPLMASLWAVIIWQFR